MTLSPEVLSGLRDRTCSTCRFWSENEHDWTANSVGFRTCKAVRERWDIQDEASRGLEWDGEGSAYEKARADALRAARAYVQDGSEYRADLVTGPDFFCALHEIQENTK